MSGIKTCNPFLFCSVVVDSRRHLHMPRERLFLSPPPFFLSDLFIFYLSNAVNGHDERRKEQEGADRKKTKQHRAWLERWVGGIPRGEAFLRGIPSLSVGGRWTRLSREQWHWKSA